METNNINSTNKVEKIDVNAKTMDLFEWLVACKSSLVEKYPRTDYCQMAEI